MPTTSTANQKIIFSKILVAIDGSEPSMDAADYAIIICKQYNAELYALHVIRVDVDLFGAYAESDFIKSMRDEGQKYLDKVKLNAEEKNIQIKSEIIASINIAGGIVDYAQQKNIDLIVVGKRGLSGFKKLLLGNVAANTLSYAHCPVMIVK
jgi:nucleotide-binding universal stress UspA family protein